MSFRDDDEFDPAIYAVGGGLPGMLWRALRQQNQQQGTDPGSPPNAAAPGHDDDPQGGLPDWLRTSQLQQSQFHPAPTDGVDYDTQARLIQGHESNNQPDAKNDKSTATGPGQFIEKTWIGMLKQHRPDIVAQYPNPDDPESKAKLLALRSNPALADDMTKAYAQDNAQMLRDAGLPVTSGNIYLAHFAGPGKAKETLRADPSTPAETIFGADAMKANPFLKQKNAGEVRAWADKQIEVQARRMKVEKAAAFQRAFSTPQPPLPAYLQQPAPGLSADPQQTPPQPVRRLVGRTVDNKSWALNPAPIASQAGVGFANDRGGAPGQSMIGLFSGKPMRHWMLPIFDTRR